jgi:hypothetical protein
MKIWDKILGKRYLDWDEYKQKINDLEEKNWREVKQKFRVSK